MTRTSHETRLNQERSLHFRIWRSITEPMTTNPMKKDFKLLMKRWKSDTEENLVAFQHEHLLDIINMKCY